MPALGMTIEVKNLDKAIYMVQKVATGLVEEMDPALIEIGEAGSKYFGGVAWDSKGSAFGMPWAPLAASTELDKSKHWPGRGPMERTYELMNSFTYEVKGSASVRLYNSDPKFAYHQGAEGHDKLPRRVMIGVNTAFKTMAKEAIKKQVKVIIEGAKI